MEYIIIYLNIFSKIKILLYYFIILFKKLIFNFGIIKIYIIILLLFKQFNYI